MAMINKLDKFLESRGVDTGYKFWKDTGLPQATAYRLWRDRNAYPSRQVQEVICRVYKAKPGEFLDYVPDDHAEAS